MQFLQKIFGKIEPLYKKCFRKVRQISLIISHKFSFLKQKIDYFEVKYFHKGSLKDKVLTKYIIKELFLYFFVAFLFFFFIFFCNQILLVAENILKKRVPLGDVIKLMWYSLPMIIAQSAPFATLVGFLMCLGRMMSDNEILILRASGQSYKTVIIPVIIMGLIISVVSFFVNDYLLPIGNIKYNRKFLEITRSNPGILIEPNSIKRLNNATIVIGDATNTRVNDMVIFDKGKDNKQRIIISGPADAVNARRDGILLQLNMTDTLVMFLDTKHKADLDVLDSKETVLNIFDSAVFSTGTITSPREMTSFDVGRLIRNLKKKERYSKRQLNQYRMEYHKKFALPFASIFFAFLAIPLAFLFGKHNGQTIGLVIGLLICVWFWSMQILGQIFSSRNGMNGIFAMWLPDAIIFIVASLMFMVLKKK